MKVAHFYHVYCGPNWQEPVEEHFQALFESDWKDWVHVGLVGSPEDRAKALKVLRGGTLYPDSIVVVACEDEGWEQVTLAKVADYAAGHDGAVMYAHTKSAADASQINVEWRKSMCRRVVRDWRRNVELLEDRDAVGCHWLTKQQFGSVIGTPIFGGNYWLATCEYLRRLPECNMDTRHDAEAWIGRGDPKAHDLLPGWPGFSLFEQPVV